MIAKFRVKEYSSALYTATLLDETGAAVSGAVLEELSLWLYDKNTSQIINNRGEMLGSGQDVLTAGSHGVSVNGAGLLTWYMIPADNACVGTDDPEVHFAVFKGVWSTGSRGFSHRIEIVVTNHEPF